MLFFAGPAAILYGGWFYFRLTEGAGVGAVLACFCLIGSYLLWCIGALAFQMQARVELKLPALLKNAICLTFRCPALVLGWLLLALALTAVMALLLPYSLPWLALLGGIAVGLVIGCANGLLTSYVGLPDFIATFAMGSVIYGVKMMMTEGNPIYVKGVEGAGIDLFRSLNSKMLFGVVPVIDDLIVKE